MIQQSTYNAGKSFQKQKGGKSLHNDQYIFYLIDKEEMKKIRISNLEYNLHNLIRRMTLYYNNLFITYYLLFHYYSQ